MVKEQKVLGGEVMGWGLDSAGRSLGRSFAELTWRVAEQGMAEQEGQLVEMLS